MNIMEVEKKIIPQITELLKKEPENILSIERMTKGWVIHCDVLERKAIPETFDLLKVFEFKADENCRVTEFKQIKKVRRGDVS